MGKVRLLGCFITLVGLAANQSAWSTSSYVDIENARVKGLVYLHKTQKGDGSWSTHDSLKVQTTATALEALINSGVTSGETYGSASAWLANAETASIDSTARKIAALAGTGMNMKPQAQALLALRTASDRLAWGAYPQYGVSFPDTPLGITAIRLSGLSYANQSTDLTKGVACEILPSQRTEAVGKGWSYTRPPATGTSETTNTSFGRSALLPTAITILELATLRNINSWTTLPCVGGSSYNLGTVLTDGVAYLKSKQNSDGGFGEGGVSTPWQTAMAYLAIQAVNIGDTSLGPTQDYLITGAGLQGVDGSWSGDPLVTALVLKTLPMMGPHTLADTDHDGVPDEIESALNNGSSPTRADGRDTLAPGNGQTVPGVNSTLFATSIRYLHPMAALQLSPAGGASYSITTGGLPLGVVMNGTGILSGIPTQIGSFSFSYSVANGAATLAQLVVTPPDGDLNDDGQLDVADVALLERFLLGHATATALQQVSADVTPTGAPDSTVDLADLQRLKRMALGLE